MQPGAVAGHPGGRPPVILTRPADEAEAWAARLRGQGWPAEVLPLLALAPSDDPGAVARCGADLPAFQAAMFVSRGAVTHFFKAIGPLPSTSWTWNATKTRAWAPGPGTARALLEAGWPAQRVDQPEPAGGQYDSEALWAVVAPQVRPGTRVLLVRGGDDQGRGRGRDWLSRQIEAAGGEVVPLVAYRRLAPVLSAAQRQRAARAAVDGSLWLFSSSEAVANLCAALPSQDWSSARALATHPRIADAARRAGFGRVDATAASLEAVVRSLESVA